MIKRFTTCENFGLIYFIVPFGLMTHYKQMKVFSAPLMVFLQLKQLARCHRHLTKQQNGKELTHEYQEIMFITTQHNYSNPLIAGFYTVVCKQIHMYLGCWCKLEKKKSEAVGGALSTINSRLAWGSKHSTCTEMEQHKLTLGSCERVV